MITSVPKPMPPKKRPTQVPAEAPVKKTDAVGADKRPFKLDPHLRTFPFRGLDKKLEGK